ncbi:MAG: ABC transporter substrate-binding protein [Chloroflexi bacterium]|nr:ABC transporter substrate-binding protein [Chloroflexota bacterium]
MKQYKVLGAALTLLAMVSMLSACVQPAGPAPATQPPAAATAIPEPAEATATPQPAEQPAEATAAPATEGLAGEVVVSLQGEDTQTWQALCDAYVVKNPNAKCQVELKPSEGYQDWIRTQFAGGDPRPSWVNGNVVADLMNAKKFVNLEDYMDKPNPYNEGKKWSESFDQDVMFLSRDAVTGELYHLSLELVKIIWFYNKDIADKIGMETPPQTWDELADWMTKAREAGYIPFSIGGDFQEFWEMRMGWLARMYQDGFYATPEKWELSRCQPDDWCFEKGVDDTFPVANWQENRHFDDANMVHQNMVRWLNAFREGKIGPKDPEYRALMEEFKKVFTPENLPPGWTGVNGQSAYALFLSGKALFWLDGGWMIGTFEKDINNLRTGKFFTEKEGEPTPTPDPSFETIKPFQFGTFDNPKMTAAEALAPWQRTIEWPVGFWSVPKKAQKQNDLEIDFMMFVTSPEGYAIYLQNKMDPNNPKGGLTGPFIVKGVEMPPEMAAKFANLKPIGNTEKSTAGSGYSRGIADYQPMVREWVNLAQQYFTGKIDLDTYIAKYDEVLRKPDLWEGLLEHMKLTEDDLQTPEKKPPER